MMTTENSSSTRNEPERPREKSRTKRRPNSAGIGRMLVVRRTMAALLILFAGVLALRAPISYAAGQTPVVVAARDLAPGHVATQADLVQRDVPNGLVPHGALRDPTEVQGRVLSDASRAGEPLTDLDLAGPTASPINDPTDNDPAGNNSTVNAPAVNDEAHAAVPVRLADPAVADFLRPGQRVDLVATSTRSDSEPPDVVAERVPVIAVRPSAEHQGRGRLIVVGLPNRQAATVAAASLTESVAVTLR